VLEWPIGSDRVNAELLAASLMLTPIWTVTNRRPELLLDCCPHSHRVVSTGPLGARWIGGQLVLQLMEHDHHASLSLRVPAAIGRLAV
jgi:hypothetical protein